MKDLFDEILDNAPIEDKIRIEDQMEIAFRIKLAMEKKGWKQIDLAKALGKKKSEISKYLSGTHNFTIDTLAKLQAVLDMRFIFKNNEDFDSEIETSKFSYNIKNSTHIWLYSEKDYKIAC